MKGFVINLVNLGTEHIKLNNPNEIVTELNEI